MTHFVINDLDLRHDDWPVRDQLDRPLCMAFAVTAAHELVRRWSPGGLSEPGVHWSFREVDGRVTDHTTFATAASALTRLGQPTRSAWPPEENFPTGPHSNPPATAKDVSEWFRAGMRRLPKSIADVTHALAGGEGVVLGLPITPEFRGLTPSSAVLTPPVSMRRYPLHTVTVVGITNELLGPHLVVRNSWGSGWGLRGHALINQGYLSSTVTEAFAVHMIPEATRQ